MLFILSVLREFEASLIGTLGNASWGWIFGLLLGERAQAVLGRINQFTAPVCAEVGGSAYVPQKNTETPGSSLP